MEKKVANTKQSSSEKKQDKDPGHIRDAHKQADEDIAKDPDLSIHSPNDDLDEGELANLGGDKNDLI
jgi:hypothetical protein